MATKPIVFLGCAAVFFGVSSASATLGQRAFLGNGMQPDVVARTLSNVQNEWKAQVAIAAECDTTSKLPGSPIVNCKDAHQSFDKSCSTIVGAIVQGSGGDKAVTHEYMDDVCRQQSMSGWHQLHCHGLTLAVSNSMSADKYRNRVSFNSSKVCTNIWSELFEERVKEDAKEAADRDAAEKKAAEEEKLEIEAHKQEAEAKAKADAQRKAKSEADRARQEAAAKAADAKAKAAEAAARAQQKKAEAEAAKKAAEQKKAEAEAEQKRVAAAAEEKRAAAEAAEKARLAAATKVQAVAEPKPVAVASTPGPVAKPVDSALVAPKAAAGKVNLLVAAAAPAPVKAGAPGGAAGAPAGLSSEAILKGKMNLKAAEQGFAGKGVKHTDGKTSVADWHNEYGNK